LFENTVVRAIADRCWLALPDHFPIVKLDEAVATFCRKANYPGFRWQRNYYERVIRDEAELNSVRQYIIDNPTHWNQDEHHAR
jgi:hypothetical protein